MKRLILASLLLLPVSGIANSIQAIDPMPECYPCPPGRPRSEAPVDASQLVLPELPTR